MPKTSTRQKSPIFVLAHCLIAIVFVLQTGLLTSCTSPEQKLKNKEKMLAKYASGVAKHLYDRNPETLKESVYHLFREELDEPVLNRLQKEKLLPRTDLGILKLEQEATEKGTTNVVEVTSVKPVGSVEEVDIPFQVDGTVITKSQSGEEKTKPFSLTMTIHLDEKVSEWPKVAGLSGFAPPVKKEVKKPPKEKKKKRRGRRGRRRR